MLLLLLFASSAAVVVEALTSSVALLLVLALALALVLVLALALLLSLSLAAVVVGHRRRRPLSLKLPLLLWLSTAAGPRLREAVESGYRVLGPSARRTKTADDNNKVVDLADGRYMMEGKNGQRIAGAEQMSDRHSIQPSACPP